MRLPAATINKLKELILSLPKYQSEYDVQKFFIDIGANGENFQSRPTYVSERLRTINGSEKIEECILHLFSPSRYFNLYETLDLSYEFLDLSIKDFNRYLEHENIIIKRVDNNIQFIDADKMQKEKKGSSTNDGLGQQFVEMNSVLSRVKLDVDLIDAIGSRLSEIQKSLENNSPLSVIFLCGSCLEGLLSNLAEKQWEKFRISNKAPRPRDGKEIVLGDWSFRSLISVSCEEGFIKKDVEDFGHILINYRNYIHPREQLKTGFSPDKNTAEICWNTLKTAIIQLSTSIK